MNKLLWKNSSYKIFLILKPIIFFPANFFTLLIKMYLSILSLFLSDKRVSVWRNNLINSANTINRQVFISRKDVEVTLNFYTPNTVSEHRVDLYTSKEPEILDWMDSYQGDGDLFDIGANIGLYSVYFGKTKTGRVFSFEPSIFNLELLGKNISLNKLDDKVLIIPNPLSNFNNHAMFNLSSMEAGGASNAFGVDYGDDGNKHDTVMSYQTLGLSLNFLFQNKLLDNIPALIKIDVDGIEHLVLEGATEILAHKKCRSIFIEINNNFHHQSDRSNKILIDSGFKLKGIYNKGIKLESSKGFANANQIWEK
jgi:FkbM family methyltransferase